MNETPVLCIRPTDGPRRLYNPYEMSAGQVLTSDYISPVHRADYIIDMTTTNLEILQRFLLLLQDRIKKSRQSFVYYTILYHLILIPVALLALAVSIVSFVISSEVLDSQTNRYLNLTIGIVAIIIAAGHTVINYLEFDLKRQNFALQRSMCQTLHEKIEFSDLVTLPKNELLKDLEHQLDKVNRFVKYSFPSIFTR